MILSYRVYVSPDEEVWTRVREGRDDVPKNTKLADYARALVARFGADIEGDDALRVGVWVGEPTEDDEDAELSLGFHWRDDTESLLREVGRSRRILETQEDLARELEEQARAARQRVKTERDLLQLAVYRAARGGVLQTDIVAQSGHERNWVRTTVRAVEERRSSQ